MKTSPRSLAVLVCTLFVLSTSASAAPKVEEQIVGPAPGNLPSYYVNPSALSIASLTMKGSRSAVVVNGVEGPLIDELLSRLGDPSLGCVNAVLFSPDGKSHVYAARVGGDYIVVRDGREIYRAPFASRTMAGGTGQLTLSPRGKHVSWMERADPSASQNGWRLVVNGKPGPVSGNNNSFRLVYSPDDSRWAYVAQKLGGREGDYFTVTDGKEVTHVGHHLRFSADNKLIALAAAPDGTWTLHSEGKVTARGVTDPENKVWISPTGSGLAAALRKPGGKIALWIDGKEISAAEGANDVVNVTFSPNGKRHLATCQTVAAHYAITDGKKGIEYRLISYPQFTADSSRALYVASSGSKSFVVVEGQESDGFEILGGQVVKIARPNTGPRFAYSTGDGMNRIFSVVADTKAVALNNKSPAADTLAFSPEGSRYAFAAAQVGRSEIDTLFVDGQEVPNFYPATVRVGAPGTIGRDVYVVFSADGRHYAHPGVEKTTQTRGLFINNTLVQANERGISRAAFSPDGKHLVWSTMVAGKGTPVPAMAVFVDGTQVVEIPGHPFDVSGAWEMTGDGVYQFLAIVGDSIKRYRITPDGDSNVETFVANAAASRVRALADAAAAKKQAEADAVAAKAKAEKDAVESAAQAKADYEAAVAAKAKARADAAAAKTKAREDAIAAKTQARADAAAAKAKK